MHMSSSMCVPGLCDMCHGGSMTPQKWANTPNYNPPPPDREPVVKHLANTAVSPPDE